MGKILLIVLGVILFGNFELQAKASSVDYVIIVQKEINKLKSVKENNKELYELFKNNLGKLEFARKEIEKVRNEGLRNEFKTIFTEINKLKMKTYPSTLLNVELWDIDDFVDKNEEVFSDYKELSKMKTNITYLITIIDSILKYKKSEVKNNSGNILKGILKDIILEKIGEYNNKKNKELYCDNCKKENLIENKINKKAAEINKNLTKIKDEIKKVKTNLKDSDTIDVTTDKIKKLNDLLKNKIEKEVKAKNENSEEIKNNEDNKNYIKRIEKRITKIESIIQKINAEEIDSIDNINDKIDNMNKLFKFNIESIDTKIIDNKNEYFNKIKEILNLKGKEIKEIKLSSSLEEIKNNINSNNNAIIKKIKEIIIEINKFDEISDKKVTDLKDTYNIVNTSRYISDLIILLDIINEYNVLKNNTKIKGKTIKTVEGIENLKDFLFKLKFQYRTLLKSIKYIENIKKGDLNSKTLISDSKNAKDSIGDEISKRKLKYSQKDKIDTSKGGSEIIVSVFANFMVKRAKEEVYMMFMELLGNKKDDFLIVFPHLVSQFGENKDNFSGGSLKSSLVYAMEEDLKNLPINILKIDNSFINETLVENANLLFTFINNLKKGFHPNEIFETLINTNKGKDIISKNKGFKFSLKLISFISSQFYNNKTSKWLSINEFNQLDTDAQKYFITLVRNNFYKEFKEKFEKKFRKEIEKKLRKEFNQITKEEINKKVAEELSKKVTKEFNKEIKVIKNENLLEVIRFLNENSKDMSFQFSPKLEEFFKYINRIQKLRDIFYKENINKTEAFFQMIDELSDFMVDFIYSDKNNNKKELKNRIKQVISIVNAGYQEKYGLMLSRTNSLLKKFIDEKNLSLLIEGYLISNLPKGLDIDDNIQEIIKLFLKMIQSENISEDDTKKNKNILKRTILKGKVEKIIVKIEEFQEKYKKYKKYITVITKYGSVFADLIKAESEEDVEAVISRVVLPPNSYRIKQKDNTNWYISLNGYVGFLGGKFNKEYNTTDESDESDVAFSIFMPIGFESGWDCGFSIFIPIIDLGSYVAKKDNEHDMVDDFKFEQILAPGLFFNYQIPKTPVTLGLGGQYIPVLNNINDVLRFGATISIDIPFFIWDI